MSFLVKPSYIGSLLPPPILSIILSYMGTISLTKLEQCCHLLRHTIVTNREYRRRVRRIIGSQAILEEEEEEDQELMEEEVMEEEEDKQPLVAKSQLIYDEEEQTSVNNSLYYKVKLLKFIKRLIGFSYSQLVH